jgi:hypothetical protein
MSNPSDQLSDEQPESLFGQAENEHEFEQKTGFANRSVTGGKGPGLASENEKE